VFVYISAHAASVWYVAAVGFRDASLCHQYATCATATAADPFSAPNAAQNNDAVTDSLPPSISFNIPTFPSLFSCLRR
jgi:hypothetical protein